MWGVWAPGVGVPCAGGGGVGGPAFAGPGLVARAGPVKRCERVLGGFAWCPLVLGGGGVTGPPWIRHIGVLAAAAGGMGGVTVPGGVGPGGPPRRGRGGRGDTVPGRGGWPLLVGGVWGWSAWWLPSHTLVLLVHAGLWPGGVGWWAVVVVGVVLVVVVVGLLVVVALVVVGVVLRDGPRTPCGYSGPPGGGWGLGILRSPWGCTVWWAVGVGRGLRASPSIGSRFAWLLPGGVPRDVPRRCLAG